jgi:hypothetical protein
MDWKFLLIDTRARVYLLWAVLGTIGFVATHFFQLHIINAVWTAISLVGLGYMYKVMPLSVRQMRHIFLAWLVPIFIGMCVSGIIFYVHTPLTAYLMSHLGAFWLAVMAVAYFWNGIVDSEPADWYWFAFVLNGAAAALCFWHEPFTDGQYLVAAVVTAWSMLNLWLFRSSVN